VTVVSILWRTAIVGAGEEPAVPACEMAEGMVPDTRDKGDVLNGTGAEILSLGFMVTAKYENPGVVAMKE
jgi:hypothetical protein